MYAITWRGSGGRTGNEEASAISEPLWDFHATIDPQLQAPFPRFVFLLIELSERNLKVSLEAVRKLWVERMFPLARHRRQTAECVTNCLIYSGLTQSLLIYIWVWGQICVVSFPSHRSLPTTSFAHKLHDDGNDETSTERNLINSNRNDLEFIFFFSPFLCSSFRSLLWTRVIKIFHSLSAKLPERGTRTFSNSRLFVLIRL